jgi:hypothetical protein
MFIISVFRGLIVFAYTPWFRGIGCEGVSWSCTGSKSLLPIGRVSLDRIKLLLLQENADIKKVVQSVFELVPVGVFLFDRVLVIAFVVFWHGFWLCAEHFYYFGEGAVEVLACTLDIAASVTEDWWWNGSTFGFDGSNSVRILRWQMIAYSHENVRIIFMFDG